MNIKTYRSTQDKYAFISVLENTENLNDLLEKAVAIDPSFKHVQEHTSSLDLNVTEEILLMNKQSIIEQINNRGFALSYIKFSLSK